MLTKVFLIALAASPFVAAHGKIAVMVINFEYIFYIVDHTLIFLIDW
jgi:hypothetical protein